MTDLLDHGFIILEEHMGGDAAWAWMEIHDQVA